MPRLPTASETTRFDARRLLLGQASRFLLVGAVATVIDVGLLNLLHFGLGLGPLTAKVMSTVAGGVVAFEGNRRWSFATTAEPRVRMQALAFVVVNLAALFLALVPLAVTRYVLGLTSVLAVNLSANVVGLGLATVARFVGYRQWVFRPDALPSPAAADSHSHSHSHSHSRITPAAPTTS